MPDRAALAKIHIALKDLGIDDGTYRDILRERYKKGSAAELSDRQAADLVQHFRRLGWGRRPTRGPHRRATDRQIRFIYALWHRLEEAGVLVVSGREGLEAFLRHQTGRERAGDLEVIEAVKVIEALKAWVGREAGR